MLILVRGIGQGGAVRPLLAEQSMITLVNCFQVPAGREEEFFALWRQVNDYMRKQGGYVSHKLHRSLDPSARFRFINVAQWESKEHFDAAHDAGFRALVTSPAWQPFRSMPGLYEVVHEGQSSYDRTPTCSK